MVKKYKIKLDLYFDKVYVFVGDTTEEAIKYVEKLYKIKFETGSEGFEALTSTLFNKNKNITEEVMMINKKTSGSTLSHEVIHSAWGILSYHLVKVDEDNHEALAYLAGYLFKEIEKILKKHGIRTKSNKKFK